VLKNAPHLAKPLALLTPVFSWVEGFYFKIGLMIYGWFAKNDTLPKSQWLNKKETFERIPTLTKRLHSSVMYYDGQLDDARYCLALAQSADKTGASITNYTELVSFEKDENGKIITAIVKDVLSGEIFEVNSKLFINCTGPVSDSVRLMANPNEEKRIKPSKGVHIVLPADVLKSNDAMLIPKTKDGRVVFVIPFEGKVMVGTTDDAYDNIEITPILESNEVDFLLETLSPFLEKTPDRKDVQAGFAGLRPLITAKSKDKSTKTLLRDHDVEHDETSNLLSLMGGKWTTYRLMAKDTIDKACEILNIDVACSTENHLLVGAENYDFNTWKNISSKYNLEADIAQHLCKKYGNLAENVAQLSTENDLAERILADYPFIKAEVIYQVRFEMACTVQDVLARRLRLELSDWQATLQAIPIVAELMQREINLTNSTLTYQKEVEKFILLINR
jgi:glycerol-3-phosphate dehydrogenase